MTAEIELPGASALKDGESLTFGFRRDGVDYDGFVIRHAGKLRGYENRCRHLPLPLDHGDGRFFDPDGRHLVCATHGATYDPSTGLCVSGPCRGARLRSLPLVEKDGRFFVRVADSIDL